jgi:hypothetical protein
MDNKTRRIISSLPLHIKKKIRSFLEYEVIKTDVGVSVIVGELEDPTKNLKFKSRYSQETLSFYSRLDFIGDKFHLDIILCVQDICRIRQVFQSEINEINYVINSSADITLWMEKSHARYTYETKTILVKKIYKEIFEDFLAPIIKSMLSSQ